MKIERYIDAYEESIEEQNEDCPDGIAHTCEECGSAIRYGQTYFNLSDFYICLCEDCGKDLVHDATEDCTCERCDKEIKEEEDRVFTYMGHVLCEDCLEDLKTED